LLQKSLELASNQITNIHAAEKTDQGPDSQKFLSQT